MFKLIRAFASAFNDMRGLTVFTLLIGAVGSLIIYEYWIIGAVCFTVGLFAFFSRGIEKWADRYVKGDTITFYDQLLEEWDVNAVRQFKLKAPARASRSTLRKNVKLGQHSNLLCMAGLLELRATLHEELVTSKSIPYEHWERLNEKAEQLFQRAQQLPEFVPLDFHESSSDTPGLRLLQTKPVG